jgi:hypothetical protein
MESCLQYNKLKVVTGVVRAIKMSEDNKNQYMGHVEISTGLNF